MIRNGFARLTVLTMVLGIGLELTSAITTIHYDKPSPVMNSSYPHQKESLNLTIPVAERQKRLLPYINHYLQQSFNQSPQRYHVVFPKQNQNQNQQHHVLNPFTESNALPGPFLPMPANRQPDYYEYQLKPQQQSDAEVPKTLIRYVVQVQQEQQEQRPPPATQQTVFRYNTRDKEASALYSRGPVEFPREEQQQQQQELPIRGPPEEDRNKVIEQNDDERRKLFEDQLKIYEDQQKIYRHQQKEEEQKNSNYDYLSKPPVQYPLYNPEYKTIIDPPPLTPAEIAYNTIYYARPKEPRPPPQKQPEPNLGYILRKLQETNALPQNLTPENVDNSIKTLIRILNALKKHQRLSKRPIVVPDLPEEDARDNRVKGGYAKPHENFPENTPEGGTPGRPGVDYPALSTIPPTRFDCKTQRYKGFFGDPDTHCQVWHYCDFNGGQASFLCPNGTIFSQAALTCDWWFNVKCATTPQLYVLNERLYKYILPFAPKFPEDYSGPLVDRYLALKFQEMEEKMKKERKKNNNKEKQSEIDADDADELRLKNYGLEPESREDDVENISIEKGN